MTHERAAMAEPSTIVVADPVKTRLERSEQLLVEIGHGVLRAGTVEEALELLESHPVHAIVAASDGPGPMALELLQELAARCEHRWLPVLALLPRGDSEPLNAQLRSALHAGVSGVLREPVEPFELRAVLAATLRIGALQRQLQHLETRDPLTETHNRGVFFERLEAEAERSCRYGHSLCVALMGMDHFRPLNEAQGYAVADGVLASLAKLWRSRIRSSDLLARYSGEQFVLLLPETTAQDAQLLVERLRTATADQSFGSEQSPLQVTFSAGIAAAPAGDRCSTRELMRRVHEAYDRAKEAGRNRVLLRGP